MSGDKMSDPEYSGNLGCRNSGSYGGQRNGNRSAQRSYNSSEYKNSKPWVNYNRPQDGNRRKFQHNAGGHQRQDYDYRGPQRDQYAHNQEAARSVDPPEHKTANNDDDIVKSYNSISPHDVVGDVRAVHLQFCITKDLVVFRLKNDAKRQQMMEEMQQDYKEGEGQSYTGKFEPGEICCVKSSRDGNWYRARVDKVENGEYIVYDLDFGYAGNATCDNIRGLKRKFIRLPVQAFKCCLEGIASDWSGEKANDWLRNFMEGRELFCWFKGPPKDFLYPVSVLRKEDLEHAVLLATDAEYLRKNTQLSLESKRADERSAVEEQQLGALRSQQEDIGDVHATCSTYPQYTHITSLVKTVKEVSQVIISCVKSEYDFYCHLKMYKEELDELNDKLQKVYDSEKGGHRLRQLTPATPCAAKFFHDKLWYRAEIKKVNGNKVDVIFVDYGNVETVTVDDIMQITEEFVKLPVQALHCVIPTPNHGKKLTDDDLDTEGAYYFLSYSNQCYKVEESNDNNNHQVVAADEENVTSDDQNSKVQVESLLAAEVNNAVAEAELEETSEEVRKNGLPILQGDVEVMLPELPEEEIVTDELGELCTAMKDIDFKDLPETCVIQDLPCSRTEVYMIEPITSPADFWVQIEDHTWNLSETVGTVEDIPRIRLEHVTEGMICASTFSDDGAWYRAKVITRDSDTTSTVLFIDYGNHETKQNTELYSLDNDIACLPPLAVHCQLSGIVFEAPWTPEAVAKFEELTGQYEKTLLAEFSNSDTSPVPVRLLNCGMDVAKTMASLGFCTYLEPDDEFVEENVRNGVQEEEESTVDRTYSVDEEDSFILSSNAMVNHVNENLTVYRDEPKDEPITDMAVESDKEVKDAVESVEPSQECLVYAETPNLDIDDKTKSEEEMLDSHSVIDLCSSVDILDASSFDPSISECIVEEEDDAEHDVVNNEDKSSTVSEEVQAPMSSDASVCIVCLDETGEDCLFVSEELRDEIRALECDQDVYEDSQLANLDGTVEILNSTNDSSPQPLQVSNGDVEISPGDSDLSIQVDPKDTTQSNESRFEDSVCLETESLQDVSVATSVGVSEIPSIGGADLSPLDTSFFEQSPSEPELQEEDAAENDIVNNESESSSIVCLSVQSVGSFLPEMFQVPGVADDSSIRVVSEESGPNESEPCERIDISNDPNITNSECSDENFNSGDERRLKMSDPEPDVSEVSSGEYVISSDDAKSASASNLEEDTSFTGDSSDGVSPRKLIKRLLSANSAISCYESQSMDMTGLGCSLSSEADESPEQKADNSMDILEVDSMIDAKHEELELVGDQVNTPEDDHTKISSVVAFDSDNEASRAEVEVKEVGVAEVELSLSEDEASEESDETSSEDNESNADGEDEGSSSEDKCSGDQVEDVRGPEEVEELNGSAMTEGDTEEEGLADSGDEVLGCAEVQADAPEDEKLNGNVLLTGSESDEEDQDEEMSSSSSCEEESCVATSTDEDGGSSASIIDTSSTDVSSAEVHDEESKGSSSSEVIKSTSSDSEEGFVGDAEDEISDEGSVSAAVTANQVDDAKDEDVSNVCISATEDVPGDTKEENVDICEGITPLADNCGVAGDGDNKEVEFSMGEEEFFSSCEKLEDEKDDVGQDEIASECAEPSNEKACVEAEVEEVMSEDKCSS